MTPVKIQRKRIRGWRLPENTVVVCRPGKWGNPFKVGQDGHSPVQAVELFRRALVSGSLRDKYGVPLNQQLHELKGRNLACWCGADAPCHADVLLELANSKVSST